VAACLPLALVSGADEQRFMTIEVILAGPASALQSIDSMVVGLWPEVLEYRTRRQFFNDLIGATLLRIRSIAVGIFPSL